MLVGMMADAAAQRTNTMATSAMSIIAMPSCPPARQFKYPKTLFRDGFRHLAPEPRSARHAAVLVGDVELQRQLAAFRDRLDGRTMSATASLRWLSAGARMSMVKDAWPG